MTAKVETADRRQATTALRDFIEAGNFAPGDRLPPERELMVSLGVTRTMLRKALDSLEHEGRIWRHVGKGTFIASQSESTSPGRLATLSGQVTPVHMMRARLALEPALAREAAINASDAAVQKIMAARDRAVEAPGWDEYEAEDDAFHRTIAEATGNVLLLELFDQLNQVRRAVAWNTVIRHAPRPPRDHNSFREHDRIAQGIAARNPTEAQAAMRDHLGSVSARLFGEV
ncbi:MAG: GntR family transcriptional regulator [Rhodobacteraceae bacterium]|nr:GntR family transcriptional regulator [Paracoccaceae bacterium]MAY45662.1 GntR family transcriptional regulator [Paracoccaceae bacterium]